MITVTHKWATPERVWKLLSDLPKPKLNHRYWLSNHCCYINLELDNDGRLKNKEQWFSDACHARLRTDKQKHNFAVLYFNYRPLVERGGKYYNMDIADILLYIDWMVNESPFAGIFLSKNPSEIYEYGALIDTTAHYGLAFAAAIASRFYYEHGREFVSWLHMVKAGVDKNAAYVIALGFKAYTSAGEKPEFIVPAKELYISHSPVYHGGVDSINWDKEAVNRWMKAAPLDKMKTEKRADTSFLEKAGTFLLDLMKDCPHREVVGGRFGGGNKKYDVDVFINYVKEKIEPVLLEMAKEKKPMVVKVPHQGDEPEIDV